MIFTVTLAVSSFAAGGVIVFIALISLGIRREEDLTLTGRAPDLATMASRIGNMHVRRLRGESENSAAVRTALPPPSRGARAGELTET